jgi:3-oxoacyl-[acyl-carrier protein] reductase
MIVDVKEKVVVITGSSRGIGKKVARRFAEENAKVVINYLNSFDEPKTLYDDIARYNKNCIIVKADVTDKQQVEEMYRKTIDAFGTVDILINNAGICSDNLLFFMSDKQWKDVINVNLNSVFLCSKIFSREMVKKNSGKIINIASLKGQLGSGGQSNYSASKAGIIGFTKALAKELGIFNVSVNAICPGYITTSLNRNNVVKRVCAEQESVMQIDRNINELLDFIIYISSDKFNYVTGRVFNIDSRI